MRVCINQGMYLSDRATMNIRQLSQTGFLGIFLFGGMMTSCKNKTPAGGQTPREAAWISENATTVRSEEYHPPGMKTINKEDAMRLAMAKFDAYLPNIERDHDASIDVQEPYTGDFTGDGVDDVAVYFSLTPKGGGNALVGQGLALYKNTGTDVQVIAGFEPDYLFSFNRISDHKIYIDKLQYAEGDGHCCPSIKEEKALTITGKSVY